MAWKPEYEKDGNTQHVRFYQDGGNDLEEFRESGALGDMPEYREQKYSGRRTVATWLALLFSSWAAVLAFCFCVWSLVR